MNVKESRPSVNYRRAFFPSFTRKRRINWPLNCEYMLGSRFNFTELLDDRRELGPMVGDAMARAVKLIEPESKAVIGLIDVPSSK